MKKTLLRFSALFVLAISFTGVAATPVKHIKDKFKLPSSEWTWDKEYGGEDSLFGMIVEKLQGAVNFRVNYYEIGSTAESFLGDVRKQLMLKKDYGGARFDPVVTKQINGKTWATFEVSRKDDVHQELWARKGEAVILFLFYTAAGKDYYDRYHPDVKNLISQASAF